MNAPLERRTRVWDLPLRLFHWGLVACVLAACISAKLDGDSALRVHFLAGYATLALLCFRVLWGFCGTRHALFSSFVLGPAAVIEFVRGRRPDASAGHSPLGGLAVLVLLATTGAFALSGLFTDDEIASEGPLAQFISERAVHGFSRVHAWCEILLYAIVAAHLLAIAYYLVVKKRNLVAPMITGYKNDHQPSDGNGSPEPIAENVILRAFVLFAISTGLVAFIASLAD